MSKNIEKYKKGKTQKNRSVHKKTLSKNRKHKETKRRGANKIKNPPMRPLESSKKNKAKLSVIPEGEQVVATTRQPKRSSAAIMRERAERAAAAERERAMREREIREREAREMREREQANRQRGWLQYFYDMVGLSSNNSGSKRTKKKKKCSK